MSHSVGQVADVAGITVRTLHHYDEIGLLAPSERTPAGHRRYSGADLDRLQQILFYRALGFPLEEVTTLLDDPDADPVEHLRRQHGLLQAQIAKLREMAAAVEHAMEARKMGINLTAEEKFEVFGDFDPEDHAEEVEQRWGGTDAYAESQRRTASYTKEDWLRIKEEGEDCWQRFGAALESGVPADSEAAMDLAEEARQQICRFYYDCTYEIHTGLAGMYVSDERFRKFYEDRKPGLARYVHDAVIANAVRNV